MTSTEHEAERDGAGLDTDTAAVSLKALHTDLKGRVCHQVPNGCTIP
ncbi:hypothetical protein [Actinomadura litoris]|nr:hypothetical protein [Actinomadura litoris]